MDRLLPNKRAMAQWVEVGFTTALDDLDFWHRVGNWQEALWTALRDDSRAFADWQVDRVCGPFRVAVIHKRDLRSVRLLVRALLAAEGLSDAASVSEPESA